MVASHLISGINQVLVVLLLVTGHAALWQLVVSAVISGGVGAFFGPAAQGMVRQLVDDEALREANALMRLTQNVVKVLAPAVGGVLIGWAGAQAAVGYNAAIMWNQGLSSAAGQRLGCAIDKRDRLLTGSGTGR